MKNLVDYDNNLLDVITTLTMAYFLLPIVYYWKYIVIRSSFVCLKKTCLNKVTIFVIAYCLDETVDSDGV